VDEGWRHHAALPAVELVFARQETATEERATEDAEADALHERIALLDQRLVSEIRRAYDDDLPKPHPRSRDVAVLVRDLTEEADAIVAEAKKVPEQRVTV
jgi:hypothetical protein